MTTNILRTLDQIAARLKVSAEGGTLRLFVDATDVMRSEDDPQTLWLEPADPGGGWRRQGRDEPGFPLVVLLFDIAAAYLPATDTETYRTETNHA